MSNRFFVTLLVVIAVVIGAFAFTKHGKQAGNSSASTSPTNHIQITGDSGVTLIEYGDYQCPACGQYYPIVKQLVADFKDKITFQFRNFPLIQIHQNAFAGARAAEAADKQGKYWEMHDLLYENQNTWGAASNPKTYFDAYAKQLGLDISKFDTDMASSETNSLINADIAEAQKLGATGTPTFVLNGQKIENPRSLEDFTKLLNDEIAKKNKQ